MHRQRRMRPRGCAVGQEDTADHAARDNRADLPERGRNRQRENCGGDRDRRALAVRGEAARHAPDRLGDDRDRDDLQPVQPRGAGQIAEPAYAVAEHDQRQRRRHCKPEPCGKGPR